MDLCCILLDIFACCKNRLLILYDDFNYSKLLDPTPLLKAENNLSQDAKLL